MVIDTNAVFIDREDLVLDVDSGIDSLWVDVSRQLSDVMKFWINSSFDQASISNETKRNIDKHHMVLLSNLNNILDRYEKNEMFANICNYPEKDISNHYVKLLQHFSVHFRSMSLVGVDYSLLETRLIEILKPRMIKLKESKKDFALYTIWEFIASKNILWERFLVIFSWLVQ